MGRITNERVVTRDGLTKLKMPNAFDQLALTASTRRGYSFLLVHFSTIERGSCSSCSLSALAVEGFEVVTFAHATHRHCSDALSDIVVESTLARPAQLQTVVVIIVEVLWNVLAAKSMTGLKPTLSASVHLHFRFSIVSACALLLRQDAPLYRMLRQIAGAKCSAA